MTITNGLVDSGGGISNYGTVTINDVSVVGNAATFGGGIYNYGTLNTYDSLSTQLRRSLCTTMTSKFNGSLGL